MAVSLPAATIRPLSSGTRSPTSPLPTSLSNFSSLSSQQMPRQRNSYLFSGKKSPASLSRPRIFPVVKAKKETYSSLDEMLATSEKPLLVDFYATWCGPCQFMVPILNQVSAALKDKIQVVKIDTEKYPAIADQYRIEALPTFIVFKDGQPCDRFEGALTADQMIQRIEASLQVKQ